MTERLRNITKHTSSNIHISEQTETHNLKFLMDNAL